MAQDNVDVIQGAWDAFAKGERFAKPPANPHTIASGLRVPVAVGDFMILDAVRASRGAALAVPDSGIDRWMRLATELEGVSLCPESAVCVGVLEQALATGAIDRDESVVLFNTGAAQKYVEAIGVELLRVDHRAVDWRVIEQRPAVTARA